MSTPFDANNKIRILNTMLRTCDSQVMVDLRLPQFNTLYQFFNDLTSHYKIYKWTLIHQTLKFTILCNSKMLHAWLIPDYCGTGRMMKCTNEKTDENIKLQCIKYSWDIITFKLSLEKVDIWLKWRKHIQCFSQSYISGSDSWDELGFPLTIFQSDQCSGCHYFIGMRFRRFLQLPTINKSLQDYLNITQNTLQISLKNNLYYSYLQFNRVDIKFDRSLEGRSIWNSA
ncbi:unnamed protein product [Paramecium octaurelia]|uniref:Uncharacterized protein n=1 Tax=Paramecium octaurelia TaxID=43137 RepID=A0A8S1TZG3_PAROT|nr:unnamed protein product [Paramecium octaurelia]